MKRKKSEWIIEGVIKKGTVNVINVAHDDWCHLLKDKSKRHFLDLSECNCDPDVIVTQLKRENNGIATKG